MIRTKNNWFLMYIIELLKKKKNYENYINCSGCDEYHTKIPNSTFRFIGNYFQ